MRPGTGRGEEVGVSGPTKKAASKPSEASFFSILVEAAAAGTTAARAGDAVMSAKSDVKSTRSNDALPESLLASGRKSTPG